MLTVCFSNGFALVLFLSFGVLRMFLFSFCQDSSGGLSVAKDIVIENIVLWASVLFAAWVIMYGIPGITSTQNFFRPHKLNKEYPENKLMLKEFFRSIRGVLIASVWGEV